MYRGRFAPSPTGALHLGSAAAAMFCAAAARAAGGELVLRMEDLDRERVVPGCADAITDDLRWLGLTWDEGPDSGGPYGPYTQSERTSLYEAALAHLEAQGLVFLCDCSRAEIARAASAPHAGEEGPRYPGTCRAFGMKPRDFKRPPAVRLALPHDGSARVTIEDRVLGTIVEDVALTTGDFVLRRGDGVFAYQLAVVVDDLSMAITEVVRGADLAASAPRQTLLAKLLEGEPPQFAHVPLVLGEDGERLAKRAQGVPLADQRARGVTPSALIQAIASAYGFNLPNGSGPEARFTLDGGHGAEAGNASAARNASDAGDNARNGSDARNASDAGNAPDAGNTSDTRNAQKAIRDLAAVWDWSVLRDRTITVADIFAKLALASA